MYYLKGTLLTLVVPFGDDPWYSLISRSKLTIKLLLAAVWLWWSLKVTPLSLSLDLSKTSLLKCTFTAETFDHLTSKRAAAIDRLPCYLCLMTPLNITKRDTANCDYYYQENSRSLISINPVQSRRRNVCKQQRRGREEGTQSKLMRLKGKRTLTGSMTHIL